MKFSLLLPALLAAVGMTAGASQVAAATTSTITFGDEDCFGFNLLACADNDEVTRTNIDNSTAVDPVGTDVMGVLRTLDFIFSFDLTGRTVNSASVEVKTAGIDFGGVLGDVDGHSGAAFFLNGTKLGEYFLSGLDAFALGVSSDLAIKTLTFAVTPSLLVSGSNTLRILPEQDLIPFGVEDLYGIDYARLEVETETTTPPSAVPLPASALMLASALGLIAGLRRRRRS